MNALFGNITTPDEYPWEFDIVKGLRLKAQVPASNPTPRTVRAPAPSQEERKAVQRPGIRGGKFWIDGKGEVRYGPQPKGTRSLGNSDNPETAGIINRYKAAKEAGDNDKAQYWLSVLKKLEKKAKTDSFVKKAGSITNPQTLAYKKPEEITNRDTLALFTMGMRAGIIMPGDSGKMIVDGKKAQRLYKTTKGKPEAYLFAMLAAMSHGERVLMSSLQGNGVFTLAIKGETLKVFAEGLKTIQSEYVENKRPELRQLISQATGGSLDTGADKEKFESAIKSRAQYEADRTSLLSAQNNEDMPEIKSMAGVNFYPAQKKGINWLIKVQRGILAFDVGVGKTMTALGATEALKEQGKIEGALIFAPKSICGQWKEEIEKFVEGKKVVVVEGDRDTRLDAIAEAQTVRADYIIVGWSALSTEGDDEILNELAGITNRAIILDEGIRVKNISSKRTRNFKNLFSGNDYIWNMTATPVGNNPLEIHTMLDMLHPGVLGSRDAFVSRYYKKLTGPDGETKIDYVDLGQLNKEISPYVFFKSKDAPDVGINIAPVVEVEGKLDMPTEQKAAYQIALKNATTKLLGVKNPDKMTSQEKLNTLAAITMARQMAIDPALVDENYDGPSVKIDRAVELINQNLQAEPGRGNIVFSVLGKRIFPKLAERIAKESGISPEEIGIISGDTPSAKRDEIRQKLNSGEIKVALLSMDAASEGMNLQNNSNVAYMLDLPWNPVAKQQAIGRIHRRGQERQVYVGQFVARGTVDEYMSKLIAKKRKMIDEIMGDELTDDELSAKKLAGELNFDDFAEMLGYTREQVLKMRQEN